MLTLRTGEVVLYDEEDHDLIQAGTWCRLPGVRTYYVQGNVPKPAGGWRTVKLHRWLMGEPAGMQVDHINGNGLDNRRSNLRLATASQNQANRAATARSKSGYRGVHQIASGRFVANGSTSGKTVYIGTYVTAEDAARAYDAWAAAKNGTFARLNFPAGHDG